jgi:hypothetical protein
MTDAATQDAIPSRLLATTQESTATPLILVALVEALGALILHPHLRLRPHLDRQLQARLRHQALLTVQPPMISWWLMDLE